MRILMMTNTYKPIVGGLERSVEIFSQELRKRGHDVLIVAPEYKGQPEEEGVFRIPAIQNFNGTDFSVELPISLRLHKVVEAFNPQLVHTHHPFLIGDTAQRISARFNIPIIFTHHTLYEENVHYVPGDSSLLRQFVIQLSTGYANLCDHVIAPSESVEKLLCQRGVKVPLSVIPTGIYVEKFTRGNKERFRRKFHIPPEAFVLGYIGRVVPEKNMHFLAAVIARYLHKDKGAYFLIVGKGQSLENIERFFIRISLEDRFVSTGVLEGEDLIDAYHACDVFTFASHSETQGLVLAEAMASGVPVIAVDAPGVREVICDKRNGRLIEKDDIDNFIGAIEWIRTLSFAQRERVSKEARQTAQMFHIDKSIEKILYVYQTVIEKGYQDRVLSENPWQEAKRLIKTEGSLFLNFTKATSKAVVENSKLYRNSR